METGAPLQKLVHTFAALADLGQEIAETSDFQEKMRTALHLVQGSLGIMRGALAEFDSDLQAFSFVAVRGMGMETRSDVALAPQEVSDLLSLGICGLTRDDRTPAFTRFCNRHQGLLDS